MLNEQDLSLDISPVHYCLFNDHDLRGEWIQSSKSTYNLLLAGVTIPKILAKPFRDLCAAQGYDPSGISDKMLWESLSERNLDYPRFTDLAWRIVHQCVRTGEIWMDKRECPICHVTQTVEHLFWDCPVATTVWEKVREIWGLLTSTAFPGPSSWPDIAFVMAQAQRTIKDRDEYRRWRILFSEAIWALWTHRCEWSFEETDRFTTSATLEKFAVRIRTRIQICCRINRTNAGADTETIKKMWGHDPEKPDLPYWCNGA